MATAVKYLFPGVAAAAAVLFGGHIWNHVAIRAIGPEGQLALIAGLAAIGGGILGEKLGFGGGGGKK